MEKISAILNIQREKLWFIVFAVMLVAVVLGFLAPFDISNNLVSAAPSPIIHLEEDTSSSEGPTFSNNKTVPSDVIADSSTENITCYVDISDSTGLIEVGFSYRFTETEWSEWGVWVGDLPPGKYTFKATIRRCVWIDYVGQRLYHRWYAVNKLGERADSPEYTGPRIIDDDTESPLISDLCVEDESGDTTIEATERFRFTANISDPSGIYFAEVHYDTDGELVTDYFTLSLYQVETEQYATEYIGPINGSKVVWRVYAVDNDTDRIDDRSAGYSDLQQFIVYEVIIDRWITTDDRCDVGSTQTVGFHASWAHNGSDIISGTLYINGTSYLTNETGWATLDVAYNTVGKRLWRVTSVSCYGITAYKQITGNPYIIWDRIQITSGGVSDPRCDIKTSQKVFFTARYEYDNMEFTDVNGVLYVNDTACNWDPVNSRWYITYSSPVTARYAFVVTSILDKTYGLSSIYDLAGVQEIIWDRLVITLDVIDDRIDVGTSMQWTFSAIYEYNSEPAEAYVSIELNDTVLTKDEVGKWAFTVERISDSRYDLSEFTSNVITCIWDRIKISEGGVSSELCNVGSTQTIWVKAVYEYDNTVFDFNNGIIYMNNTPMSWSSAENRWEYHYTSDNVETLTFTVTSVTDNIYGLTSIHDISGLKRITWTGLLIVTLKVDKTITNTGSPIQVSVQMLWAHNNSAVSNGVVGLNETSFTSITNSSGWATFQLIYPTITADVVFEAVALRSADESVTLCLQSMFTPKLTWTELWVEDLKWDKDTIYEGEKVTFLVKIVWAHNGSAVPGGTVSINRTFFGVTNSSGWATITFKIDVCGVYTYTAYAESDFTGYVTKCTKILSHRVLVTIVGDLNFDGKVDIRDIAIVAYSFGSYASDPRWNPIADINEDGKVDIRDIAIVASNFGKICENM